VQVRRSICQATVNLTLLRLPAGKSFPGGHLTSSQDIKAYCLHNSLLLSGTCRGADNSVEDGLRTEQAPALPSSGRLFMPSTSTILVVEDDDIVRMLIVDVLEELAFRVLEAADAGRALEHVQNPDQNIHLMMTDVGLPDMDGKQLAHKVRELHPALPILFASGYAENIDVPAGMHVIGKPFSIDQLRDKVRSILGTE
jgi:CheY-like chemotaxis protein